MARIKNSTILLDLDGTLLDSSFRLYRIYRDLLLDYNLPAHFSRKEYWQLKRDKVSEEQILKNSGLVDNRNLKASLGKRMRLIEKKSYLIFDRLVRDAKETISLLHRRNSLILVTNRKSRRNLLWELKKQGIRKYFFRVLSAPLLGCSWEAKAALIKSNVLPPKENTVFIGDTESDFLAAEKLKIKSIAVLNGARSKKQVLRYRPDYVCDSIARVPEILRRLATRA